ncbi:hypothetical protein B0J11DRAFT_504576 [Dendryphion nanum]|uniref:Uncharacterized protein n=1 Tax=Dendryphion nanum TaxID=256645 RepID=A0A9P9E507_9PLEO|nr:hypothetical protein B0J11DRAFT_504576 [Dendryphion nanum]
MKNDADLKAYDELRKRCKPTHAVSIDESYHIATVIVDIMGLAGIGVFVVGGLAAIVGIISFAAVMGGLKVVGALAAAAGFSVMIESIYEGAIQRQPLTSLVNGLKNNKTVTELKDLLLEGLKEPWECTLDYCREKLYNLDVQQGAWMNEDRGEEFHSAVDVPEPIDIKDKALRIDLSFTPSDTGVAQSVILMHQGSISNSICIGTSKEET